MEGLASIEQRLLGHLPAGAAVLRLGYSCGDWSALPDAEKQWVVQASNARKAGFAACRTLARAALQSLGTPVSALGRRADGSPDWPPGVVGSLSSHAHGLVAAVVARQKFLGGVGIDMESATRLPASDAHLVLTEAERRRLPDAAQQLRSFSAKESVYKCLAPLGAGDLEFLDIEVLWHEENFSAIAVTERGFAAPHLTELRGSVSVAAGHIVSLCYLPGLARTIHEGDGHYVASD